MLDAAVHLVTAAAVLVTGLVWLATRSWHPTVPVMLDLLLAAGLLRLAFADSWSAIGGVALVVAIRVLVRSGFEHAHPPPGSVSGGVPRRARAPSPAARGRT